MRKGFALAAILGGLGAVGCTTTNPDKKYMADEAPPLAKGQAGGPTTAEPFKLPPSKVGVRAEAINEDNYLDEMRKLDGEIRTDQRAMTKLGR